MFVFAVSTWFIEKCQSGQFDSVRMDMNLSKSKKDCKCCKNNRITPCPVCNTKKIVKLSFGKRECIVACPVCNSSGVIRCTKCGF